MQKTRLRTGFDNYTCVTRKSNGCKEILPRLLLQTDFIDYTCVTRKSNGCKEILPRFLLRTGFIDYTCVTRKSNGYKEMKDSSEVPVIPVSHVSFITPRTYGRNTIFRPTQVCASARRRARRGRRTSLTVKRIGTGPVESRFTGTTKCDPRWTFTTRERTLHFGEKPHDFRAKLDRPDPSRIGTAHGRCLRR